VPNGDKLMELVQRWNEGDREALDQIVELLYDELRAIARRHLTRERDNHTLTTTALVHEAYVKLSERTGSGWQGRPQFLALASKVMRHLLIDHARRRNASRRGGKEIHVPLDEGLTGVDAKEFELLSLDQALERLEARDERMARIVECRFFGGMRHNEIADALGVSVSTVERDWTRARAYLLAELSRGEAADRAEP
jgi:RNA polymerase sigma factor (TIGR02999 family)